MDLGKVSYSGKQISDSEMHLCQKKYINELIIKAKMNEAKPLPTPITSNLPLSKHKDEAIANATICYNYQAIDII